MRSAASSTRSPPRRSTRKRFAWRGCRGPATPICSRISPAPTHVAMMFYSDALRVVLATVHIPLARGAARADAGVARATIALTARELPRFGDRAAADRRRRAQSARRRARPVRRRGRRRDLGRRSRRAARAASTCRGPFPGDTVFVRAHARRIRRRRRLLSRSGADSGEADGLRPGRECDARACRSSARRSITGRRSTSRQGRRRSREHDRGGAAGGAAGAVRLKCSSPTEAGATYGTRLESGFRRTCRSYG